MLAAALATTAALATLGQAQRVGTTLDRVAGQLTHTANNVGAALHSLAQKGVETGHFC